MARNTAVATLVTGFCLVLFVAASPATMAAPSAECVALAQRKAQLAEEEAFLALEEAALAERLADLRSRKARLLRRKAELLAEEVSSEKSVVASDEAKDDERMAQILPTPVHDEAMYSPEPEPIAFDEEAWQRPELEPETSASPQDDASYADPVQFPTDTTQDGETSTWQVGSLEDDLEDNDQESTVPTAPVEHETEPWLEAEEEGQQEQDEDVFADQSDASSRDTNESAEATEQATEDVSLRIEMDVNHRADDELFDYEPDSDRDAHETDEYEFIEDPIDRDEIADVDTSIDVADAHEFVEYGPAVGTIDEQQIEVNTVEPAPAPELEAQYVELVEAVFEGAEADLRRAITWVKQTQSRIAALWHSPLASAKQ